MNAQAHRLAGAVTLATLSAALAPTSDDRMPHAAVGCAGGYCFGTLPDIIEPATSPHHRQFFHSWAFAGLLAYGTYRLYRWDAPTLEEKCWRAIGLIAGGAYLVHLALDAMTKRSLPVIGRV